jgi:putative peptide zinc metalloprotease protein
VLGLEVPQQHYMPRSRRTLFVTYAVASYLYRWVVTFSILFFLYHFLKPHKLGSISAILAVGSFVPLVVLPLYQMLKFVGQPGRMRKVKKARAFACLAGFVGLLIAIMLIPTPLQISGTLVLTADDAESVYAEVPGQVVQYHVRDGDHVKAGDLIATLRNLDKHKERDELQSKISLNRAQHDYFIRTIDPGERDRARIHLATAEKFEPMLDNVTEQIGKLNLVAPCDGIVIGMPHPETIGQWLHPNQGQSKPLCQVADPTKLKAVMILDQSDVDLVTENNHPKAWLKIYGTGSRTIESHVKEVAKRNREDLPPELSNAIGGEIAAKPDSKTGEVKPLSAVFEVSIPVDNSDLKLEPGLRGKARIDAGHASLGWWLWRLITKTFHFNL